MSLFDVELVNTVPICEHSRHGAYLCPLTGMPSSQAYLDHSGILGPPSPGDPHRIASSPSLRWWWHRYALLLAAAAHDVGHPARMNPFMVATKRHLGLHYDVDAGGVAQGGSDGNNSGGGGAKGALPLVQPPPKGGVLEAMHASTFLALTRQHNVLEHLGGGAAEARLRETVRLMRKKKGGGGVLGGGFGKYKSGKKTTSQYD
jgi:hypothetical protein